MIELDMQNPQDRFKCDNLILSDKLRRLVVSAVDRAQDLIDKADSLTEVQSAVRVAEVAGKITGIVQEKQPINLQVNQISGFTFIEVDKQKYLDKQKEEIIDTIVS